MHWEGEAQNSTSQDGAQQAALTKHRGRLTDDLKVGGEGNTGVPAGQAGCLGSRDHALWVQVLTQHLPSA